MSTCYILTWHHHNENQNWGFYSLVIDDIVTINGYELNCPIFSYQPDSKLYIYPGQTVFSHYPATEWNSNYSLWQCEFSSNQVQNFISKLNGEIDANTLSFVHRSKYDFALSCRLKSTNPFRNYTQKRYNCFAAVATWVNWLGNNSLLSIYNNAHNVSEGLRYMDYSPAALFERYAADNWYKTDYNNTPTTTLPVT